MSLPSLSVLVAHRDDSPEGWRDRLWDFCRPRLEVLGCEIVVGTNDETPFRKTAALNDAAARASGDVFLITDTDTWVHPEQVHAAIDSGRWCRAYRIKVKLERAETERALADPDWEFRYDKLGHYERRTGYSGAPPFVVPRHMWEAVGGFDTRIAGWGSEDMCFALSLKALFGPQAPIPGFAVHFWHPRIGVSGNDRWPGQQTKNGAFEREYRNARSAEQMRTLIGAR
jgi:hypothetical protein